MTFFVEYVYSVHMNTYKIINDKTGEVIDTAETRTAALCRANYLTASTRTLHYVPYGVTQEELAYAV